MNLAKAPRSLRFDGAINSVNQMVENNSGKTVSAVAGLMAVASFSGAEAQQSSLPPVTVDAPVARPRPAAARPSPDQLRARTALRRAARGAQPAQAAAVPFPNAGGLRADRNPYADAAAPYKIDHLQASGKFPEPMLNTPKTVTVLSKEVLEDKNATTLKQAILSTAGVTLGTGEGGNAFGDRFFIRGFDARNDIFIDGVRDAGVSVRENFFTEQVEILRGPGSSFAGRGTTGGAINIVTKQATSEQSFYNMDTTFGTDHTKRVVLDVNQVISPTLAVRAGGLFQDAGVAGRDYIKDDRDGGFVTAKWTPLDTVKLTANYIHTNLHGLPDFGVPYYRPSTSSTAGGPFPDFGANRNNFYGFVNRDFYKVKQDIGTINGEVKITPDLTLSNKTRIQRSVLDYIGTLPESPVLASPLSASTLSANPQSRYQTTDTFANQTEATYKFNLAGWKHTTLAGLEVSQELASIDNYTGLSSEALTGGLGERIGHGRQRIFSAIYARKRRRRRDAGRPADQDRRRHHERLRPRHRQLQRLHHPQRRHPLRRLQHQGERVRHGERRGQVPLARRPSNSGCRTSISASLIKPLPIASVYAAYATSSNPVGAEFDGTSAQYGGLAPIAQRQSQPDLRARTEPGRSKSAPSGSCSTAICW